MLMFFISNKSKSLNNFSCFSVFETLEKKLKMIFFLYLFNFIGLCCAKHKLCLEFRNISNDFEMLKDFVFFCLSVLKEFLLSEPLFALQKKKIVTKLLKVN